MADLVFRARSPVEILDAAVSLFRRHAAQYVMITAAVVVPLAAVQLVVGPPDPTGAAGDVTSQLVNLLATVIGFSVVFSALTRFGDAVYHGRTPDAGASLRAAVPLAPRIIAATVAQWMLIFVGAFGLIIGAFWMLCLTFAVTPVLVLEGRSVADAFSRSSALSKGRKRHIFSAVFLSGLVYTGVAIVVSLVGLFLEDAVVTLLLNTVVQLVAYPILSLTYLVLYYDARIRSEGYDLDVLQASLDPAPSARA
ncbi:MAG: hypothetical protein MUF53_09185 [Gemmatimonadaceae bacterium]|jgi:hypothetical protein|nr:hypothetical protein [Gemmatimonadaceae bacterium]